ncbi:hypothetical protein EYF80_028971 [Liparis tanakae]|uniref:Uncharacterized protein n=1 Tax=Liparis tanakae TaxID=230148 RepID=A0A4Z2H596_9TELE|nr:hypothetical protein EYF80_028971 [Liparis tanakae]
MVRSAPPSASSRSLLLPCWSRCRLRKRRKTRTTSRSFKDSSRAGLGIGPVAQLETEKQVGSGVEDTCSQLGVTGPVVVLDSVPVAVGPEGTGRGFAAALIGGEATGVLGVAVQAGTVNVSAVEGDTLVHGGPEMKTGSVHEVRCPVVRLVCVDILHVASVTHAGPGGLVSDVKVSVAESIGPVAEVGPCAKHPVVEATTSALGESTVTSIGLISI